VLKRRTGRGDSTGEDAVVVCGAGAAGLAAAISAARHGARVVLVEQCSELGGTVSGALIHTLAGFYDATGQIMNDGLARELTERLLHADAATRCRKMSRLWVLNVCPNVYRRTIERWIAAERRISVIHSAQVIDLIRCGDRIEELTFSCPDGQKCIRPRAVVDATGSAQLVRLVDASLVLDDLPRAAGGWIFRIRGIDEHALDFPKGVAVVRTIRMAARTGELPPECAHAWLDSGVHADEAFVKLMLAPKGSWQDPRCLVQTILQAERIQAAVLRFLQKLPEFTGAEITQTGRLGVRDGGRIRGRYTLTGDDVRAGRTFPDAVCRCDWPIEYWDGEKGVSLEYLPAGAHYEIPMRSLQLSGVQNLWAAGKCLSADREAHASARVVGTCWAMGEAAGAAAARSFPNKEERGAHEHEYV